MKEEARTEATQQTTTPVNRISLDIHKKFNDKAKMQEMNCILATIDTDQPHYILMKS